MKRIQIYLLPELASKLTVYADINNIKISKYLREVLSTINNHIIGKGID
jgi:hypothetical protein